MDNDEYRTRRVGDIDPNETIETYFSDYTKSSLGLTYDAGMVANAMVIHAIRAGAPQMLDLARRTAKKGEWNADGIRYSLLPTEYPWDTALKLSDEADHDCLVFVLRTRQELSELGEKKEEEEYRKQVEKFSLIEDPEERKEAWARSIVAEVMREDETTPKRPDPKMHKDPDACTKLERVTCHAFTVDGKRSRFASNLNITALKLPDIVPTNAFEKLDPLFTCKLPFILDENDLPEIESNAAKYGITESIRALKLMNKALAQSDALDGTDYIEATGRRNEEMKSDVYRDFGEAPRRMLSEIGLAAVCADGGAASEICERTIQTFAERSHEQMADTNYPYLVTLADTLIENGFNDRDNVFRCNDMNDKAIARDTGGGIKEIWIDTQNRRYLVQITTDPGTPVQMCVSAKSNEGIEGTRAIDDPIRKPLLWFEGDSNKGTESVSFATKGNKNFQTGDMMAWQAMIDKSSSILCCLEEELEPAPKM